MRSCLKFGMMLAFGLLLGGEAGATSISMSQQTYTYITDVGYYQVRDVPYTSIAYFRDWTVRPQPKTQAFSLSFDLPPLPADSLPTIATLTLLLSSPFLVWNAAETRADSAACFLLCFYDDAAIHVSSPPESAGFLSIGLNGRTSAVTLNRFSQMDLLDAGFGSALVGGGTLTISGYERLDVGNAPVNVTDHGYNAVTDFSIRASVVRDAFAYLNLQFDPPLPGIGPSQDTTAGRDDPPVATSVPEPGTLLTFGAGLSGLAAWGRRRAKPVS